MSSSDDDVPLGRVAARRGGSAKSQGKVRRRVASSSSSDGGDSPRSSDGSSDDGSDSGAGKPRRSTAAPKRGRPSVSKAPTKAKAKSRSQPKARPRPAAKRVKKEDEDDFERGDARKHFKEGQTKLCPPVGDGCRAFYETLLQENPNSLVAIKWCIERGCLMGTQQKEVLAKFNELKEEGAFKPPIGGLKPGYPNLKTEGKVKVESSSKKRKG